jgi:phosphoglycolate phosphatase
MKIEKNLQIIKQLSRPDAVIFDWDNTLANSWPLIQSAIDKTMIAMNKEPWGLEKVRDNVHKSMRESFPEIFGNDWQKAGEIYKKSYHSANLTTLTLLPYALDFLELLNQKNIPVFGISNKIGYTLRKEINNLGLDYLFYSIVGAQDADFDKPSHHPVDLALMGFDIKPLQNDVWFIGDTITDIECAYNSGCRPILYSDSLNHISQTIPQSIISSDDFNRDFTHLLNNQYYGNNYQESIDIAKQGLIKSINPKAINNHLPIIIGYQDLISSLSF